MVWVEPRFVKSKTKSQFFSRYKTLQVDGFTQYALQKRKAGKNKGGDAEFRVISSSDYPYYEVAVADCLQDLQPQWTYLTMEIPSVIPAKLNSADQGPWLLDHIAKLAKKDLVLTQSNAAPVREVQAEPTSAPRKTSIVTKQKDGAKGPLIQKQLEHRVRTYSAIQSTVVAAHTWNVNAKKPSKGKFRNGLREWLIAEEQPSAHIVAVGFQEIVDLTSPTAHLGKVDTKEWEELIAGTLADCVNDISYLKVKTVTLVGLALMVYVDSRLAAHVTDAQAEAVGVGLLGVGGNKGAVCVRFDLYDTSFCFVNSHLAAHQAHVSARNADYHTIVKRLAFTAVGGEHKDVGMFDHDVVMWIGDLNYRLDLASDLGHVHQRIRLQDWHYLLDHDQLNVEKAERRAFEVFREGPINFAPTYKYQPGTSEYEQRPEKKIRFPAWCDRIQWRGAEDMICQLNYTCCMQYLMSDHKPVSSLFLIQVLNIIPEEQAELLDHLRARALSQLRPSVTLNTDTLSFGEVQFGHRLLKTFVIDNVSDMYARFHVVPLRSERQALPPWLSVFPSSGMLVAGGRQTVSVVVHITASSAHEWMTKAEAKVSCTLMLQIENGVRDFRLRVTGRYVRSCFGSPLRMLTCLSEPLSTAASTPSRLSALCSPSAPQISTVPKELVWLISALAASASPARPLHFSLPSASSGVGRRSSMTSITHDDHQAGIDEVRSCLDRGSSLAHATSDHLSASLIAFLLGVPSGGVLPRSCPVALLPGLSLQAWTQQALLTLPSVNFHVLVYVVSFARHIIKGNSCSQSVSELAQVLGASLTQWRADAPFNGHQPKSPAQIFEHLLAADVWQQAI